MLLGSGPLQRGQAPPHLARPPPSVAGAPTDPTSLPAGGILQDYFTDLCFHLKRGDVKTLRKCEQGCLSREQGRDPRHPAWAPGTGPGPPTPHLGSGHRAMTPTHPAWAPGTGPGPPTPRLGSGHRAGTPTHPSAGAPGRAPGACPFPAGLPSAPQQAL